jgi:hypothetical protein
LLEKPDPAVNLSFFNNRKKFEAAKKLAKSIDATPNEVVVVQPKLAKSIDATPNEVVVVQPTVEKVMWGSIIQKNKNTKNCYLNVSTQNQLKTNIQKPQAMELEKVNIWTFINVYMVYHNRKLF